MIRMLKTTTTIVFQLRTLTIMVSLSNHDLDPQRGLRLAQAERILLFIQTLPFVVSLSNHELVPQRGVRPFDKLRAQAERKLRNDFRNSSKLSKMLSVVCKC